MDLDTMTLDSSVSKSIAFGNSHTEEGSIPAPEVEKHPKGNFSFKYSYPQEVFPDADWHYIFIHHRIVPAIVKRLKKEGGFPIFIHKSVHHEKREGVFERSAKRHPEPTISGLVFIQGYSEPINEFFKYKDLPYHLVIDCSTGKPATIKDEIMRPFRQLVESDPSRLCFLPRPFEYYMEGHKKVRIVTGDFARLEGYVMRVSRDRKMVIGIGDMTVALSDIHREHFEEVEEDASVQKAKQTLTILKGTRPLTELQHNIDRCFYVPKEQKDIRIMADSILLFLTKSQELLREYTDDAVRTLPFLLEEIAYYFSPYFESHRFDITPVLNLGKQVLSFIDTLLKSRKLNETYKEYLSIARKEQVMRHGYLFDPLSEQFVSYATR